MIITEINSRIRELRLALGLNQTEFGEKVGLHQSTIGQIENSNRNVSERLIILLVEKYRVNEHWLRTGQGEKFMDTNDNFFSSLASEYDLTPDSIAIIRTFAELPVELRRAIINFVRRISANLPPAEPASVNDAEELYKKSLSSAQSMDASASPTTAVTGDEAV